MGDQNRRRSYKNCGRGDVAESQEERRKSSEAQRKNERMVRLECDNRRDVDTWVLMSDAFSDELDEPDTLDLFVDNHLHDIASAIDKHPYAHDSNSIDPDIHLYSAKLLAIIPRAITVLKNLRSSFRTTEYKFRDFVQKADMLPVAIPITSSSSEQSNDAKMDTDQVETNSNADAIDPLIENGTVRNAWNVLLALVKPTNRSGTSEELASLLCEFIAFISSLKPSYFCPVSLPQSHLNILDVLCSGDLTNLHNARNILFIFYNIFQGSTMDFTQFVLNQIFPIFEKFFENFCVSLDKIMDRDLYTVDLMVPLSLILKYAFNYGPRDNKKHLCLTHMKILTHCREAVIRDVGRGFISHNLSSIIAEFTQLGIGSNLSSDQAILNYLKDTFRDTALAVSSSKIILSLTDAHDTDCFLRLLTGIDFITSFKKALVFGPDVSRYACYKIMDTFIAKFSSLSLIDHVLVVDLCKHLSEIVYWGTVEDRAFFYRFIPVVLSTPEMERDFALLLESDLINAYFSFLPDVEDENIVFNALDCLTRFHEFFEKDNIELFKVKVKAADVLTILRNGFKFFETPQLQLRKTNAISLLKSLLET